MDKLFKRRLERREGPKKEKSQVKLDREKEIVKKCSEKRASAKWIKFLD